VDGKAGEEGREVALDAYDLAEAAEAEAAGAGNGSAAVAAGNTTAGALATTGGKSPTELAVRSVENIVEDHVDTSAGEMMQQLKREADAYVNPQTAGTGLHCSPRHMMPFNSRDKGLK